MFSLLKKKSVQKPIAQSNSFASEAFFLRRFSEANRYKLASLIIFVSGFGLLTLGTWFLNEFSFLTFTN